MPISKDYNFETGQYEGRICKFCRKEVKGRLDKKFCSEKCKTRYRNEINSFKNKFEFNFEPEAHNYFLLARELRSIDIMVSRSVGLLDLTVHGFDFRIPCPKFIGSDGKQWFRLGNLFFTVFPDQHEIRVKHSAELRGEDLVEAGQISLENAFPELKLRTLYQGPI